ncbi:rhomboid family intramembrane serine protease rho-7 [Megachile rotundata]|uniref:rhomboid family intramembrane serine protease rho-7 n=1 Tax=Megachile rotundata TaxID=143995 RepID=UPI0006151427|nr:PREDICTED: presenilins-associated rhomboid-like protein, mitochondrial [Megachile rotundata]
MALRSFLHLNNNMNKCIFTIVQLKFKTYVAQEYAQIRNFSKLAVKKRLSKSSITKNFRRPESKNGFKILKPFTFTIMFSGATFIGAVIWEYEGIRERTHRMIRSYKQWGIHRTGWRGAMQDWWDSLSEGEKIFVPICFLNILVFLSWHIPAFRTTMNQYFCSSPASSALCWPLLLSTFSHYSLLHLMANMYVLHNFSTYAVKTLGKEQFVLLYLVSGVLSGFTSHLYKLAMGFQNPSLGASGAVMGIIGYSCIASPDIYLSIIFFPMLKFKASTAIKVILGVDVMGCLLRWQRFDHAAHLGGALFGIFWQLWGSANIWQKREPVLMFWHQLREKSGSR